MHVLTIVDNNRIKYDPCCCEGGRLAGGRCGVPRCGRNIGRDGRCGRSRRNTGWHIWLATQTAVIVIDVVKKGVTSGDIMMASMDFVVKPLKLIDLFGFYFLVAVVLDFMNEKSGPVLRWCLDLGLVKALKLRIELY